MLSREPLRAALTNANVQAFGHVVREGESRQDDLAYRMRFGGLGKPPAYFNDLSRHPKIFEPTHGNQKSSAAGAYQATWTTWSEEQKKYGWPDFTPQSQDEFFVARLIYRKALNAVIAGKFDEACRLCHDEWTSLPGGAEENAATKRARETYIKWGGKFEPVETVQVVELAPAPAEAYSEATATSPVPEPIQHHQEKPMAPILAAILPSLLSAAPDLIRIFGSGGRTNERNAVVAEKVAQLAVQVTGAVNEQEAATKLQADPQLAEKFKAAVSENFDQWMGMMVKFKELDEASLAKAREFAIASGREPVAGRFTFVELLSLVMVVAAILGGAFVLWDPLDRFNTEMQTAVIILMLIGGWNGVKEFWLGSSMGSQKKDQLIASQQPK